MALLGNYNVLNKSAGRFISGASLSDTRANFNKSGQNKNAFKGQSDSVVSSTVNKAARPNGYLPPYSWVLPDKAGGIASTSFINGAGAVSNGNLAGGRNAEATVSGSGGIASASMQLILSAVATLSGVGGLSASIVGKLDASATLAGQGDISGALGALASAVAAIQGSGSLAGTSQAKGNISASITPFTELSPATLASAVWNKTTSELTVLGSIGKKLADSLPVGLKKNTAIPNFQFFMVDANDHVTGKAGLSSFTCTVSIDGASFVSMTNSVFEIGQGVYKINITADEMNGDIITFRFSATGADTRVLTIITEN